MSLAAKVRRALTLAPWDNPQRILIDRFVSSTAQAVPRHARVLDAGAGECAYAPAFAHCQYVACDRAVGDAYWDYGEIDVVADLASLPFRAQTFDAILCTQALEHVGEPADVIRNMAAALKTGGRLYISVPFIGDPIHQEPYDFFRYTHYGLRYLVEKAGLTPVAISPMGGIFLLGCCYLWWCAIAYRLASRDAEAAHNGVIHRSVRRIVGAVMLLWARLCTMLIMTLRLTERSSYRFTFGYTVIAEKM
jgi:SAM-dependent methyltransferase